MPLDVSEIPSIGRSTTARRILTALASNRISFEPDLSTYDACLLLSWTFKRDDGTTCVTRCAIVSAEDVSVHYTDAQDVEVTHACSGGDTVQYAAEAVTGSLAWTEYTIKHGGGTRR